MDIYIMALQFYHHYNYSAYKRAPEFLSYGDKSHW